MGRELTAIAALLAATSVNAQIQLNQVGYLPGAAKWAAVPDGTAREFVVVDDTTGREVLRAPLAPAQRWTAAEQALRLADFSALKAPGRYRVRVTGEDDSPAFAVAADAYAALAAAAQKAYYFNRAGLELKAEHAGPWARPAGHADARVRVHASAASASRPAGTEITSPKGWYEAGDYNQYIVNSGITVYTLLAAWEHFPAFFRAQRVGIPESGGPLPDLLAEVRWNLDWMLSMQDPADGGVYHKLTNERFDGVVMPHLANRERWVVQKGTAATLDFAAVAAQASRVWAPFDAAYAARLKTAALAAWGWAQANPAVAYRQPPDIHTGGYDDQRFDDEFAWAAAELYVTTRDDRFWAALKPQQTPASVPWWGGVDGLAWTTLAHHRDRLTPAADRALIERRITTLAAELEAAWAASPVKLPIADSQFDWGRNSGVLNRALMLVQGFRVSGRRAQLDAAQAALDYVLGRNALAMSQVTGIGARSPLHPHHRPSEADGVAAPVPGFVVGGPNAGRQDAAHCPPYPHTAPARAYLDHFCSYASNEVAINWNAPLVYLAAALQSLTPEPAR